jgi:hypothetical protein
MAVSSELLRIGANYLNPPNDGQGAINTYLGKPVRVIARIAWAGVVCTIGAVAGVIFHSAIAIWFALRGDSRWKIQHHYQAAYQDLIRVLSIALPVLGIGCGIHFMKKLRPLELERQAAIRNNVTLKEFREINIRSANVGLPAIFAMWLGVCSLFFLKDYAAFVIQPDQFK